MRQIVTALFVTVFAFMFLSAGAADALGLQSLRVGVFVVAILALLLAAMLAHPWFSSVDRVMPVVLLVLLVAIAAGDLGDGIDLLEYKIALPVLAALLAPNLAGALAEVDLPRLVWRILTVYVAATFATYILGDPQLLVRGYDTFVRVDLTGSLVAHGSLCGLYLALTFGLALRGGGRPGIVLGVPGALALAMIFLGATRTVLLALALFMALLVWVGPERRTLVRACGALALGGAVTFGLHTAFVSDGLYARLFAPGMDDYSSGRWSSIGHWLALAADRPFGLGFGAVRAALADGRPALDGTRLLEWPHDEFVRFWVEAGPAGLVFVVLFAGWLSTLAVAASRYEADPAARALMLAIAADLMAQTVLQNYFNTVYHATVWIMILTALAAKARHPATRNEAAP